jgi:hypothetical protein
MAPAAPNSHSTVCVPSAGAIGRGRSGQQGRGCSADRADVTKGSGDIPLGVSLEGRRRQP